MSKRQPPTPRDQTCIKIKQIEISVQTSMNGEKTRVYTNKGPRCMESGYLNNFIKNIAVDSYLTIAYFYLILLITT